MDAKLKEERVMDKRLAVMPFVSGDYGKMPSYAIFRVSEKKIRNFNSIRGFSYHMLRISKTPNSDPERRKNNEQLYGAEDIFKDTEEYLKDCKIYKNSVIGRELLLSASPQFFKGMIKEDFEHWKDINIEWCKKTFGENFRAAYLHLCESSPHIHILLVCKQWNEKRQCYTLQNYRYFNGYQKLRDMQDDYHNTISKDFPALQRGCRFSKAKHNSMKKIYGIMDNTEKENLEVLQAKAANQELLKMKVNYMDKTLKSFQHFNRQKDEVISKKDQEIKTLLEEIQALKNNNRYKDIDKTLEATKKDEKSIKRGFSGRRYNKSV